MTAVEGVDLAGAGDLQEQHGDELLGDRGVREDIALLVLGNERLPQPASRGAGNCATGHHAPAPGEPPVAQRR
ncbi:hypothetical protein [Streptomyces sp. NPDC014006]|uniref:hypothetical protein n=1 Tax=Streptomyces sp. NPDC014006 TaxID=3364870 RepID=UPI003701FBB9